MNFTRRLDLELLVSDNHKKICSKKTTHTPYFSQANVALYEKIQGEKSEFFK